MAAQLARRDLPPCGDSVMMLILANVARDEALHEAEVMMLARAHCSARLRKTVLMQLHARGLATDREIQRAFDEHPELGAA